ncbi:MAG: D-cysteine desulfhydrase family protein [Acidimicrobiia bacterium]|nr:D-cysteine desulfhydrase family protein [Acidimicrobiia bacterium]
MSLELPRRIPLAITPTPLEYAERLSVAWGGPRIWFKRDDLTGFGLSGNKVRKLEFHLAAAIDKGADTVVTCGSLQSNHSRATALACARLGLHCVLLLRRREGEEADLSGNLLLDQLAGAEIRYITPADWDRRDELLVTEAASQNDQGRLCWVIPEGASDGLGMWGFVLALREIADQAAAIDGSSPVLWHAASSGGTTAGIGWGVDRLGLKLRIVACSIGDPGATIRAKVEAILAEAAAQLGIDPPRPHIEYNDAHVGGGYGVVTDEELEVQAEATRLTGLIFDPTYTGKALAGLHREIGEGRYGPGENIVFWHTGGGFAVFAHDFSRIVAAEDPGAPDA